MSNYHESGDVVTISRGTLVGIIVVAVFVVGLLAGLVLPKIINNNGSQQTAVVQAAPATATPAASSYNSTSSYTPSVTNINAGDPPVEEICMEEGDYPALTEGRFPTTSIKELSMYDLYGLSLDDLDIMRNEIYARHGYIFKSEKLRRYFSKQDWYYGETTDSKVAYARFNAIEKKNVQLIKEREKYLKGK